MPLQPTQMQKQLFLRYFFATVWLANGFVCKVLNFVPRHGQIVGRILGETHASLLTVCIGLAEIGMAIWIISGIKPRWNALTQIAIVLTMNLLEFFFVPDLLLWGRFNLIFASLFVCLVYYNEFLLRNSPKP